MGKIKERIIKNKNEIELLAAFGLVIIIIVIASFNYNRSYNIQYSSDGIKYQSNNLNEVKPIKVEVRGVFLKNEFGTQTSFEGDIIVDGINSYGAGHSNIFAFSRQMMSFIENEKFEGFIFASDKMEEITITLDRTDSSKEEGYSFFNGWLISTPCKNREQAVDISNKLIQKLHRDVQIK